MHLLKMLFALAGGFVVIGANAVDIPCDPASIHNKAKMRHALTFVSTPATRVDQADDEQSIASDASPKYVASVVQSLHLIRGPQLVTIDGKATFAVPAGFLFLGKEDTGKLMALLQNPIQRQYYLFSPRDFSSYGLISYTETGHVPANEPLDPQAIMESIKSNTEASNAERDKKGWGRVSILGWRQMRRFDALAKRVEWAVSAVDAELVSESNFNTRILGRTGTISTALVVDETGFERAISSFRTAVRDLTFVPGERYEGYREGDRLANYGVNGLVADGTPEVRDVPLSKWGGAMVAAIILITIVRILLRRRKCQPD